MANQHQVLINSYAHCMVRRVLPLLVFAYLGLLIILSQLDAVVDWGLLRQMLLAEDSLDRALTSTVLVLFWSLACSAALRGIWVSPEHRWLTRQPLPPLAYGLAWLAAALPALPPVAGWAWLTTPGSTEGMVNALALMLVASGLMVILAIRAWLILPAALALAFAVTSASQTGIALNAVILGLSLVLVPWLGQYGRRVLHQRGAARPIRLSPRGPVTAAMLRDLLLAIRRRTLLGTITMTLLSTAFLWALVNNGGLSGSEAQVAAIILLAVAVWPAYEALERVQLKLPEIQRFPKRWPLSDKQRLAAVLGSALCLTLPAALLMLLASVGALGLTASLLLVCTSICLACCICFFLLLREAWYPNSSAVGAFLLTILATTVTLVLAPWTALIATGLFLAASQLALRRVLYG